MPESQKLVVGAAPEGAADAHSSARAIREMFTSIAPRYDLLNHVLSFNVDRLWWRRTARAFAHILERPDAQILDLCCGTGDMTFALSKQAGRGSPQVLGADFSHAMLERAHSKSLDRIAQNGGFTQTRWVAEDAPPPPVSHPRVAPLYSTLCLPELAYHHIRIR